MFVCCECCVLSGRGLCDVLITCPEESYWLWCVILCDLETSWMRRPWPTGGSRVKKNMVYILFLNSIRAYNIWRVSLLESKSRIRKSINWYKNSLVFSENGVVSKTGSVERCYEQIDSSSQPHIQFHQVRSILFFSTFHKSLWMKRFFPTL